MTTTLELFTDGTIWAAFENDLPVHAEATEADILRWAVGTGRLYRIYRTAVEF